MAQVLHKITLVSPPFRHGYSLGLKRVYRGDFILPDRIDEGTLTSIVRNLCELAQADELTENQLKIDCGILLGWIVACRQ